jgi:predicted metal-dependent enzyme (double-stranded beta helix superfamily)
MYRDPQHGFVLLAHSEYAGLYRPPHDHGRSWVIYAMQQGEIEMGTYARVEEPVGSVKLVKRGTTLVRPGQVHVYLPGDIHDTRCMTGPALLFRFTERDLKKEDRDEHRVTRYVERNRVWTVGSP